MRNTGREPLAVKLPNSILHKRHSRSNIAAHEQKNGNYFRVAIWLDFSGQNDSNNESFITYETHII